VVEGVTVGELVVAVTTALELEVECPVVVLDFSVDFAGAGLGGAEDLGVGEDCG
jgi:hypothetical protein